MIESICGVIKKGQDNTCKSIKSRFYQQAVVMNFSDVASKTINTDDALAETNYNIEFALKDGKKGFRFSASENGSAISGTYDVDRNDFGYTTVLHRVNMALTDLTEEDRATLAGLTKGKFIVALQRGEIVDIWGAENGLSTSAFTADVQGNSGFVALTLESLETGLESHLPLVYKASVEGQEIEDFDSNFATSI